jgi:hypothetical protein
MIITVSIFGNAGLKSEILKLTKKIVNKKRFDKKYIYIKIVIVNWEKI